MVDMDFLLLCEVRNAIEERKKKHFCFLIFISSLFMKWNDEEIKNTLQEDKKIGLTNFNLWDPYKILNFTNYTCTGSSRMITSFLNALCFSVLNWMWIVK